MRTEIGCVALLLGAMGIVTCAAASENAAGVAGKRGLSPIIAIIVPYYYNYIGNDRAVFLAEFEGKVYKIVVNLVVTLQVNENPLVEGEQPVCPPAQLIKVTKPSSGDTGYGSGHNLASVSVTFADLAGGAVGQAVGNIITLDDNAANYNWFIDTTPADNSEGA